MHRLHRFFRLVFGLFLVFSSGTIARSEVRLPKIFGNHMVLQQGKPIVIWGWAEPGEKTTVQIGKIKQSSIANEKGEWKISLPPMKASGPHSLNVSGRNEVRFDDVMIGEVWLCSGQSNMEMGMKMFHNSQQEIAAADHPRIRLMLVENRWASQPQHDIQGTWKICTPKTIAEDGWNGFSATAYYFGREIHKKLGVAIGLIDSDWGGTKIESWTPPEGFASVSALEEENTNVQLANPLSENHRQLKERALHELDQWHQSARTALLSGQSIPAAPTIPDALIGPQELQHATALYNGMIHPLAPFAIRGAIWYQGESNMGDGIRYADRMKALVTGWRHVWRQGDFPFYFVQIAPFQYPNYPAEYEPEIWEAQALAAEEIANSGMVVTHDVGDLQDIHPQDKMTVGHRLALLALAKTYHMKNLVYSGPVFRSIKASGHELQIQFDHTHGGLVTRDGKSPDWFEIIDAEQGSFVKADARILGDSVIISSSQVKQPVAMRYAWSQVANPNLTNREGLPARAFRATVASHQDWLRSSVPEAADFTLVYDLDLKRTGPSVTYLVDRHRDLQHPFDRIAYSLELQDANLRAKHLFVSMDAFTDNASKIGVPTAISQAAFQEEISNINVYSNDKSIICGNNQSGGHIEFWSNDYLPENSSHVANASSQRYDFGDQRTASAVGYGSMQIHQSHASQTLLAINNWRGGSQADVGIGNQPSGEPDWTFAKNAGSYRAIGLKVWVRTQIRQEPPSSRESRSPTAEPPSASAR